MGVRRGLRLLEGLATPHEVDRYLELVHPMLTVRELRAVVTRVEWSTRDSVILGLRTTRQWRGFAAGQFVQVAVDIDGVRHTRCYSPCSSQHGPPRRLELCIRAHDHGVVSRWLYAHAQLGLVVGLTQADGDFRLPARRPDRILLISGGSGITPVLSMLRTLADEQYAGEVAFLHYARTEQSVSHRAQLRGLAARCANLRLMVVYTRQPAGAGTRGHFDRTQLAALTPWYAEAETFVCGPPGLRSAVAACYAADGIADRLHTETFTLHGLPPDSDATGTVQFANTVVDNSGATLLEQAEAAGLTPEYGCRMGICFTCTKVKTAGCIRDVRTGELHDEPGAEIQLCVSVPVGNVAVEI